MRLIRHTLLVCALLVLAYAACMRFWQPSYLGIAAQSQWQVNAMRAQGLLYERTITPHTIVVGSSLAARMPTGLLPKHTYNLSMVGMSTYDGLRILQHEGLVPKRLLIETNVLQRPARKAFLESTLSPLPYQLRKWAFVLQDKYQPAVIAGETLTPLITTPLVMEAEAWLRQLPKPADSPAGGKVTDAQAKQSANKPNEETLASNLSELQQAVAYFQSQGSEVLFFEMPVDPQIAESVEYRTIREHLHKAFPTAQYTYLPRSPKVYTTTDGIHLNARKAAEFAQELSGMLEKR